MPLLSGAGSAYFAPVTEHARQAVVCFMYDLHVVCFMYDCFMLAVSCLFHVVCFMYDLHVVAVVAIVPASAARQ